ncbi:MAG: hypothetical protein AAB855_02285, partial [Patescibacteria group bacterium]
MQTQYEALKEKLVELAHLSSATSLLHWDMETNMPKEGADMRGQTISVMSALCHEKFTSPEFEKLITELYEKTGSGTDLQGKTVPDPVFSEEMACVVREIWRDFSREKKLPSAFVAEFAKVTSDAHAPWVEARTKSDFSIFLPTLKKIVELSRQKAEYVGYEGSPYNALIDGFEQDATIADFDPIFEEMKEFLVPFIAQKTGSGTDLQRKTEPDPIFGMTGFEHDSEKQKEFCHELLRYVGFPFERGRLD